MFFVVISLIAVVVASLLASVFLFLIMSYKSRGGGLGGERTAPATREKDDRSNKKKCFDRSSHEKDSAPAPGSRAKGIHP